MKTVLLIRHGATAGNLERRYIGRTDEPLCALGEEQSRLLAPRLPRCDAVFSSPLLRCRQTAAILFPGRKPRVVRDLRECDFGLFEGKNADELAGDRAYGAWLETGCTAPIPGGEDVGAFRARSARAFARAAFSLPEDCTAAFVLHGGVIMAVLSRFARPARSVRASFVGNCECVVCACEEEMLAVLEGPPC